MSQQINLFNPAFEPQRQLFGAKTLAAALGVLVVGLAAFAVAAQVRVAGLQTDARAGAQQLQQAEARLAKASVEFAPRKADPALQARLAQTLARLAALQKVAAIIDKGGLGNTQGYAETFRALARQGGQGVWLTGVSIAGGADLAVRGRALDAALVPGFIGRLGSETVMRGKSIGSLAIDPGEAKPGVNDSAQPEVKPAGSDTAPPFVEFQFQSAPLAPAQAGAQEAGR